MQRSRQTHLEGRGGVVRQTDLQPRVALVDRALHLKRSALHAGAAVVFVYGASGRLEGVSVDWALGGESEECGRPSRSAWSAASSGTMRHEPACAAARWAWERHSRRLASPLTLRKHKRRCARGLPSRPARRPRRGSRPGARQGVGGPVGRLSSCRENSIPSTLCKAPVTCAMPITTQSSSKASAGLAIMNIKSDTGDCRVMGFTALRAWRPTSSSRGRSR